MNKIPGKNIRLLRHQRNWSQQDMAERLHITVPAVSKIETGITDASLSRLEQISTLFEINVVDLLAPAGSESEVKDANLELLTTRLSDLENQVTELRRKVIQLYNEMNQK